MTSNVLETMYYLYMVILINFIVGEAVSSGLFDRDQVPLDISQLEASNAAMVMDYLTSENITIVNGTASLDGRFLCFGNIPTAVRDTINSVVPIEPVCGRCGN